MNPWPRLCGARLLRMRLRWLPVPRLRKILSCKGLRITAMSTTALRVGESLERVLQSRSPETRPGFLQWLEKQAKRDNDFCLLREIQEDRLKAQRFSLRR